MVSKVFIQPLEEKAPTVTPSSRTRCPLSKLPRRTTPPISSWITATLPTTFLIPLLTVPLSSDTIPLSPTNLIPYACPQKVKGSFSKSKNFQNLRGDRVPLKSTAIFYLTRMPWQPHLLKVIHKCHPMTSSTQMNSAMKSISCSSARSSPQSGERRITEENCYAWPNM